MIANIYKKIIFVDNDMYNPYRNIEYDNLSVKFTMYDDRTNRIIETIIKKENNKYIAYGKEYHNLSFLNNPFIRSGKTEIKTDKEFWIWYNKFYNSLM